MYLEEYTSKTSLYKAKTFRTTHKIKRPEIFIYH